MRKIERILSIVFFFFLFNPNAFPDKAESNKNVLILYSMVPSTPAYRVLTDDIRNSLTQAYGDGFTLHMEYLETERYPIGEYPVARFDIINKKYSGINLDLLICIGIDIIGTIKAHADAKLLNLPTLSLDYDFSLSGHPADLSLNDKTTEFRLKVKRRKSFRQRSLYFQEPRLFILFAGHPNQIKYYT